MKYLYVDAINELPLNTYKQRGQHIQIKCYVQYDHSGDKVTRRSQTVILLYFNSAPIILYYKHRNKVDSSSFVSEFASLGIASDLIISLRYKLLMFGIPIDGPANVFCDNEYVYRSSIFA